LILPTENGVVRDSNLKGIHNKGSSKLKEDAVVRDSNLKILIK
jgi:hypothetical protein